MLFDINMFIGVFLIFVYVYILYLSQKKSTRINIGWFFLIPLVAYGYMPAFMFKIYGIQETLSSIDGLIWNITEQQISVILYIFNIILFSLLVLQLFLFYAPVKKNNRYYFSQQDIKYAYFIILGLTVISFFVRYDGLSGYINFISYGLRRDAYNEIEMGGGILSRYDLLSLMFFSISLYYFYEKIKYKNIALFLGVFSILILVISGSRLPLFCSLFIWLYVSQFYIKNYKKIILKTLLFMVLFIPFSTFWGVARNSGWSELDYSSYFSFLKIIPDELYSVYFSTSSYIPNGNFKSFLTMFFPEKILNIWGVEKYSISEDVNSYLRGPYAPAVYIVPISTWITYPLGSGILGIFFLTVSIFLIYIYMIFFTEKLKLFFCISPVLVSYIFFIIRLDPGAWSSRIIQTFILYFIILFLVKFLSKFKLA